MLRRAQSAQRALPSSSCENSKDSAIRKDLADPQPDPIPHNQSLKRSEKPDKRNCRSCRFYVNGQFTQLDSTSCHRIASKKERNVMRPVSHVTCQEDKRTHKCDKKGPWAERNTNKRSGNNLRRLTRICAESVVNRAFWMIVDFF